jgi:O-antigen/teichoic acid export membrane protein
VRRHRAAWVLKIAVLALAAAAAVGLAVMSLWNWLAPELIGAHPIDFVQAVGLLLLCRILFGGFRGGFGGHRHWRARMAERLEQMTPEERERFQAGLRARCGGRGSSAPPSAPSSDPSGEQAHASGL